MKIEPVIAQLNDKKNLKERKVLELLEVVNSLENLENSGIEDFEDTLRIIKNDETRFSSTASKILRNFDRSQLSSYEDYLEEINDIGADFYTIFDEKYPQRLKQIQKPPLALYVKGDIEKLNNSIAIVGTRNANSHRIEFSEKIGQYLAQKGYTVTSGLATGIDTAGHTGALKKGNTVAVLPGDIENIYPGSNRDLAKRIERHGALVSEVSDNVGIHRGRFVERNRIISGLSKSVIIGASGESGGTIHQARFAKQQDIPILLYHREEDNQSPDKLMTTLGAKPFRSIKELNLRLEEIKEISTEEEDEDLSSFM